MESIDQLFQLIHSLSKSEKRYFKIYSSIQSGNKKYIELFDLIEKQKQYDEKKLKSKLKITAFAVAKNYLYNLILKSLRTQNHKQKKLVNDLIENAENLLEKGLYDQSCKQLLKAKKSAEKYQLYPLLIEINSLKYLIASMSQDANLREEIHAERNKEFGHVTSALHELFEYRWGINFLFYKSNQRGKLMRNEREKKDIDNEISELLKRDPEKCLSFKAKNLHYSLAGLYYKTYNNVQESYNQLKKSIKHLNSDKDMLALEIGNYIGSMNNIMNCMTVMGKHDEIEDSIKKMKALPVDDLTNKMRIFAFTSNRQMVHYTDTRQYKKGIEYIDELKKQIPVYENKMELPAFFALCLNIEEFYFAFGDFKQTLQWNNKVLNHPQIKRYHDFYSDARIAELIIHYELNNVDTFQSLVKSYQLFLKRKSNTGEYETACLHFFKELDRITNPKNHKQAFIYFLDHLKKLSANSYEKGVFDIFDLEGWLKCKIDGKKFSDLIKINNQ